MNPSMCGDDPIWVPSYKYCNECDRLAEEFEEARKEAVDAAADAQDFRDAASESATNAATSERNASDSASDAAEAQRKAEDAQEAAETAQGKAEDAQEAAETAQGKAEDAQEAAESARDAAAQSATNAAISADIAQEAADKNSHLYGAKWDKTTNRLTRVYEAANITTDTTNFKHNGSFNTSLDNPFDLLYPWSDIKVCDVDLVRYRARTGQEILTSFITAVYGDPDFTYEGSQTNIVCQYVPEFWYHSEEDSLGNVTYLISTTPRTGFKHHEEAFHGISFAIDAGLNANNQHVITCGTGVPYTNIAGSTLHQYAKNSGFSLMNADEVDAITTLFLVEFANWNSQNALGDGCSNCSRENDADVIANVDNTGTTTVFDVEDSALSSVIYIGSQVDFGATRGATTYKAVVQSFTVSGNTYSIVLDRVLENLTDGMFMSVHGFDACEFPLIGASVGNGSGYIGTNSKANAWYRGAVLFANRYQYTLGLYKEANTGKLWRCPENLDPDDYDAINTSVHEDTGITLPTLSTGAWQTVGDNAQRIPGLASFMATGVSSGSSSSPVGDQQYVPAEPYGATVLWLGCAADGGWFCGVLGCRWGSDAGPSPWAYGGRPFLKKSL